MSQALKDNSAAQEAEASDPSQQSRSRLLAAGGIFGALIASSCCVAPLVLVTLGAWIGSLTALEPYKPYFLTVTAVLLASGFWHVYFKPKQACEDGSYCARPASRRITKSVLWIATVLALLSATVNFWAPLFY